MYFALIRQRKPDIPGFLDLIRKLLQLKKKQFLYHFYYKVFYKTNKRYLNKHPYIFFLYVFFTNLRFLAFSNWSASCLFIWFTFVFFLLVPTLLLFTPPHNFFLFGGFPFFDPPMRRMNLDCCWELLLKAEDQWSSMVAQGSCV